MILILFDIILYILYYVAGGAASTGPFRGNICSILDLVPRNIHDKCPVIIGCKRDVDMVLAYHGHTTSDSSA